MRSFNLLLPLTVYSISAAIHNIFRKMFCQKIVKNVQSSPDDLFCKTNSPTFRDIQLWPEMITAVLGSYLRIRGRCWRKGRLRKVRPLGRRNVLTRFHGNQPAFLVQLKEVICHSSTYTEYRKEMLFLMDQGANKDTKIQQNCIVMTPVCTHSEQRGRDQRMQDVSGNQMESRTFICELLRRELNC